MLFSRDMIFPMDLFLLVIRTLPLFPRGKKRATTSGGGLSALSNTINHSSWIESLSSVGREYIDDIIVLGRNLCTIIPKSFFHKLREKNTYKRSTRDLN